MARIKITVDESIEALLPQVALNVRATAKDGKRHFVEVGNPLGHPANPMKTDDIAAKFRTLCTPVLDRVRCETALDGWHNVRAAGDVGKLMDLVDLAAST